MSNWFRFEVYDKNPKAVLNSLNSWACDNKFAKFERALFGHVYLYNPETEKSELETKEINIISEVFSDPILNYICHDNKNQLPLSEFNYAIEIFFKEGVTDNKGKAALEGLNLLNMQGHVLSGTIYLVQTTLSREILQNMAFDILLNPLLESCKITNKDDFLLRSFATKSKAKGQGKINNVIGTFDFSNLSDDELLRLSKKNCWALNLAELKLIKEYYLDIKTISKRKHAQLPAVPTDIEIEILAQSWSEHCKHKIFAANIEYHEHGIEEFPLGRKSIKNSFKTYIKNVSEEIIRENKIPWAISLFSDNAGIVRFDDKIDICAKVETHNSPSALDPYGGALTGILGVNRDILGTGIGARPILNTDVFCFATDEKNQQGIAPHFKFNDYPQDAKEELPKGVLSPGRIFKGVHKGVEDGGNKSGIPTVNGSINFHSSFAGKPLVYVGTVGVIPHEINGIQSYKKEIQNNDFIVMAGGRIGRDGVHGATMSSLELDDSVPLSVVQIGDPITQKRLQDFLIEARDLGLYRALTDNGAGGLSSSVGEMALLSGGATIDLRRCPLKYDGLLPWEVIVSESQERMTFAVDQNKWNELLMLAGRRNVEIWNIGKFENSGVFSITNGEKIVASIDLDFLHKGLPPMELKAQWCGADAIKHFFKWRKNTLPLHDLELAYSMLAPCLKSLLARPNIKSKWPWISQYDHEVGAATIIRPHGGDQGQSPNNAGGVWLYPHGGALENGILVSNGLCPRLSLVDPYLMAISAVDEAVRNGLVHGAEMAYSAILDNFCWPDPLQNAQTGEGDLKLGMLVRALEGLKMASQELGLPMISGKDSMKNDFKGKDLNGEDITISALPTLLVTMISRFPVKKSITAKIELDSCEKKYIYLLGENAGDLRGSELCEFFELPLSYSKKEIMPWTCMIHDYSKVRPFYQEIEKSIREGEIKAAHDLSEGGLAVALSEMLFNSPGVGVKIEIGASKNIYHRLEMLFGEGVSRFVVCVSESDSKRFEHRFANYKMTRLGITTDIATIEIYENGKNILTEKVSELKSYWE